MEDRSVIAFCRRFEAALIATGVFVLIVALWQTAVDSGGIDPFFISTPLAVAREALA